MYHIVKYKTHKNSRILDESRRTSHSYWGVHVSRTRLANNVSHTQSMFPVFVLINHTHTKLAWHNVDMMRIFSISYYKLLSLSLSVTRHVNVVMLAI
jgi:hypothetical protein